MPLPGSPSNAIRRYSRLRLRDPDDPILACYDALFGIRKEYRHSLWAIERDWDNIEELYTQADLLRLSHLPSADKDVDVVRVHNRDEIQTLD